MNIFKNLVLLIGTNPLPNFVVAKYFSDTFSNLKNIYLIHSSGNKYQSSTLEYAKNIEKVLRKNSQIINVNINYVSLSDIENQKSNVNDLNSAFEEVSADENIDLNYTGGTKTMGIHVYNFLKDKYNERFKSSYLSAKTFKLINENGELITEDLRKKVNIDFTDLLDLHGFSRINKDCDYKFEKALSEYAKYINDGILDDYFTSYQRKDFVTHSDNLIASKKSINKEIQISGKLLEINNLLPVGYNLFDIEGKLLRILPEDKNIKKVVEFIDGKWIEEYFYNILKESIKNNISILKNWEIQKPSWSKDLKFELDIMLIFGYQLCGISITTISKKAKCKNKGFEIIMRTRQIGGDESKSILITRLHEKPVKELQNELELDTGGTSKNILILGKDDFKKENLIKKIKYFMEVI